MGALKIEFGFLFYKMLSLLGLRRWLSKDMYGLIIKMLSKHDLVFIYLAHGCKLKLTIDTMNYAAKCGYINQMRYLHENGCKWDSDTPMYAAWNGHLDCLKYAHENGCEWDSRTPMRAARNGHLDCLKYARDEGCPEN
jgi:Ankyrin repeats (3 copies)